MEITEVVEKVRKEIKSGGSACIAFDGEISVIRGTSTKLDKINSNYVVGIYNGKSTDEEIIDDTIWFIEQYNEKQAAQSRRFAKAMGVDNQAGAS